MTTAKKGAAALTLGALGVVFGDIGTSPLYALQALFGTLGQHLTVNEGNVYGIISLVIWSIMLVVSVKYIGFIMRADNKGEGGVMALVTLIKSGVLRHRAKWFFVGLGIVGVSLFYGDSVITPAISVLSAVEGVKVVAPHLGSLVLPITLVILAGLFAVQKYGTTIIGRLFGPVMLLWFLAIGAGGAWRVRQHPGVLQSLSPLTAVHFIVNHPGRAFIAMTAVVLAITGAEALYADLGHFGRRPIARAWFFVVFPALVLCYMGEGALMLHAPATGGSVLFQLFPASMRLAVVVLATIATLIASQSVISGAFSLTRQAMQLGFLPKLLVRHTSIRETGQIYLPFINFLLCILVTLLVLLFGSSVRLASAYGVAVSGTLAVDTILFLVVARSLWKKSFSLVMLAAAIFVPIDFVFVTSNATKVLHGALFPIVIAACVFLLIDTWTRGQRIVTKERQAMEGRLQDFIDYVHRSRPALKRIPGQAVYLGHHADFTPLALRATVGDLHELPKHVAILTVQMTTAAHVPVRERAVFDSLGYDDGISHLTLQYGFHDAINIPKTLQALRHLSPELDFDAYTAVYFVSFGKITLTKRHNLAHWRKALYRLMSRNELSASDYYKLPTKQTEEIQSFIKL